MKEFYTENKENVDKVIVFTVFVALIYVFARYLASYFAPLIFGYVVCFILSPMVNLLNKRLKLPRPLASIISIIFMILTVISLGISVVSKMITEGKALIENSPHLIDSAINAIKDMQADFSNGLRLLPEGARESATEFLNSLAGVAADMVGSGVKIGSLGIVKVLPGSLFVMLLGLICSFFLLNDRQNIEAFLIRQLPAAMAHRLSVAKSGLIRAIGGYIRAQCILMCIISAICVTGLTILGNPYALLLGVLIAFVDALPVFGSGAFFWPWALYSIIVGNYKMAIGLAIINITVLVTRQVLEPRILGSQIGLHPVATLMSIFIGLKVFGLFGFIIGPIILVTIKALQDNGLLPAWK